MPRPRPTARSHPTRRLRPTPGLRSMLGPGRPRPAGPTSEARRRVGPPVDVPPRTGRGPARAPRARRAGRRPGTTIAPCDRVGRSRGGPDQAVLGAPRRRPSVRPHRGPASARSWPPVARHRSPARRAGRPPARTPPPPPIRRPAGRGRSSRSRTPADDRRAGRAVPRAATLHECVHATSASSSGPAVPAPTTRSPTSRVSGSAIERSSPATGRSSAGPDPSGPASR